MSSFILTFGVTSVSFCLFAWLFDLTYTLSNKHLPFFQDFPYAEKGDWSSRINSTIHAIVLVSGIITSLCYQQWDNEFNPMQSTDLATAFFSFATGYFLFDLFVCIWWKVPLWPVFVIHHIVAVAPYILYNATSHYQFLTYLLSLFLLVEIAVIPLNITTFLELCGYGRTKWHSFFFYTTYITWFFVRVLLPIYIMMVMWIDIIPEAQRMEHGIWYLLPVAICGHVITLFCVGVFVFVWTPDVLAKWRNPVLGTEEYEQHKILLRQSFSPKPSPHFKNKATYGSVQLEEV